MNSISDLLESFIAVQLAVTDALDLLRADDRDSSDNTTDRNKDNPHDEKRDSVNNGQPALVAAIAGAASAETPEDNRAHGANKNHEASRLSELFDFVCQRTKVCSQQTFLVLVSVAEGCEDDSENDEHN